MTVDRRRPRALALTFDDGPDPLWTPTVLQHLRLAGHVKATFFVLGERVRQAPGLIDEILRDGHAVGLHGDAHLDHRTASAQALGADTQRALSTLRACGVDPLLWRLPWGRPGTHTRELARAHGLEIVGWDVDTHDWRGDGWGDQPPTTAGAVADGAIVLLHDALGPGAPRTGCANTIEIVTALLAVAEAAALPVCSLTDQGAMHA